MEAALDALYAESPAKFTKARDALAKSLTAKGDSAAAAKVRALRKPSVVAYALNQIARKFPDDIAALADVGRALARAQRKTLRGEESNDLREAITRQREALRGLVRKATSLLHDLDVPATHLVAVTSALQTALVDPNAADALETGRLETVPEAATGFLGDISSLPAPRAGAAKANAKETAKEKAKAKETAKATAAARARADVARKEADVAAAKATKAAAEASQLEKAAKEASARARELAAEARRLDETAKRAEAQRESGT